MVLMAAGEDQLPQAGGKGRGKKPVSLAKLCSKVITKLDEADKPMWSSWLPALHGFDTLESDQRMIEVAKGLRLCQMVAGRRTSEKFRPISDSPLHQSTETLTGIGPKMAANLAERGIETVEDLLWLVPRRYDDVRDVQELSEVLAEPPIGERVVLIGDIHTVRFVRRGPRGWIDLRMKCDEGTLIVRWFNAKAGMCNRYEEGGRAVFAGKISERGGCCEMANPDVLALVSAGGEEKILVDGVVPRYGAVPGVPTSTLRKACQAAARRAAGLLVEAVPPAITKKLSMTLLADAITSLHQPHEGLSKEQVRELNEGASEWHRRLAFEELFVLAVIVAKRRSLARSDHAKSFAPLPPAANTNCPPVTVSPGAGIFRDLTTMSALLLPTTTIRGLFIL